MPIESTTSDTKRRSGARAALPPLVIKGRSLAVPIVQGGMGEGVSLHPLARAVAREGGLGAVSSAAIDRVVSKRLGRRVGTYEAEREEIAASKTHGGLAGINIMVAAVQRDDADAVRGANDAGADAIISGGGAPVSRGERRVREDAHGRATRCRLANAGRRRGLLRRGGLNPDLLT